MAMTRGELLRLARSSLEESEFDDLSITLFRMVEASCVCEPQSMTEAAKLGNLRLVQELAASQKDISDRQLACSLHVACIYERINVVMFLTKTYPRIVNNKGCTQWILPIQLAALKNSTQLIQILLDAGANIDQKSSRRDPNCYDSSHFFREFDDLSRHPDRYPALFLALWSYRKDVVACLLDNGASTTLAGVNQDRYINGMTQAVGSKISAFSIAAFNNDLESLKLLLNQRIMGQHEGAWAVFLALAIGRLDYAKILLENGAPAPTLQQFSNDELLELWYEMIFHTTAEAESTIINTIAMLLKRGTPIAPFATARCNMFYNILSEPKPPVLKWLLQTGLFELRYTLNCRIGGTDDYCALKRRDYSSVIQCFTYYRQYEKLRLIFDHLPDEIKIFVTSNSAPYFQGHPIPHSTIINISDPHNWDVANAEVVREVPYERVSEPLSLLRLCIWAVRSRFVKIYGPRIQFHSLEFLLL